MPTPPPSSRNHAAGFLHLTIGLAAMVASPAVDAQCPIDQGLIAHWKFDDFAAPGHDSAGTHDGTLTGSVLVSSGLPPIPGNTGALQLQGGVMSVPDSPDLNFATGQPMSFALWIKQASGQSVYHVFGKRTNCVAPSSIHYQLARDSAITGLVFGSFNQGGTGTGIASGLDLPIGQWCHVAFVYDGAIGSLYMQGALRASTPFSFIGGNIAALLMGGSGTCGQGIPGTLDDVRFYNRALTTAEVTSLAAPQSTTAPVMASVVPAGGGSAQVVQIGTLAADVGTGSSVEGVFTLDPGYAYLDDCYDFAWINVEARYTVNGVAQGLDPVVGLLPAIDPAPTDGPEPFYYNAQEWGLGEFFGVPIRKEGEFSKFRDARLNPPPSTIDFQTYLVAYPVAGGLAPQLARVLAGFAWSYSNPANSASICGPLASGAALINQALGNGQSCNPWHVGCPGFPNWSAVDSSQVGGQIGPCQLQSGSPASISLAAGGTQTITIQASPFNAGQLYLVLGSVSGTLPGFPLGPYTVHLNPDGYLDFTLNNLNSALLQQSLGFLDSTGGAAASFTLPPNTLPALAGWTVNHVALAFDLTAGLSVAFVSPPVPASLVP